MPNNDVKTVKIGGVTFNKEDVKSSKVVIKDGKKMNSVFLQDGTHIEYPKQKESNQSAVDQKNHVKHKVGVSVGPHLDYGPFSGNTGDLKFGPHVAMKNEVTSDKDTSFYRIKGATITGTENTDRYDLRGCNDTTVDVSQNDGKEDRVEFNTSTTIEGGFFTGTETVWSSENNKVKINDSNLDSAYRGIMGKKAEEPQIIQDKKTNNK